MMYFRILLLTVLVAGGALDAVGQTRIDLRTQGRNPDFSTAGSTKPVKTGVALPASCEAGEMYLRLEAPSGQNLYACVAANTWALQSSGSGQPGALVTSQLQDFQVEREDATTLTINSQCGASAPCNYRVGGKAFTVTAPSTATLAAGSTTGTAYFYLSGSGELTLGYSAGLTVACAPGCTTQSGVTGFPVDSIPLFLWSASTTGQWDEAGIDQRALTAREGLVPGFGLLQIADSTTGRAVLEVDPTLVTTRTAPPLASTTPCSPAQWAADSSYLYICTAANTWLRAPLSAW